MIKEGSRVRLINVPKYAEEDQNKAGTVKKLYYSTHGELTADILLDGDNGLSVCFVHQLTEI